jgi:hypothetical protein
VNWFHLKKIKSLTFQDWKLIFLSVCFLTISKFKISFFSFKKTSKSFGKLGIINKHQPTIEEFKKIEKIRLATLRASRIIVWKSVCLDQAMCGALLLQKYNIPYTLYLGVRKKESGNSLDAHAWIICGEKIILGGEKSKHYMITASYSKMSITTES